MLKKFLCFLAAFAVLFSCAMAEQAGPRLIEAKEGEPAAMQIRSLEGDQAVGILGVESEPQRRRWEDFSRVFTTFVKKNWNRDVQFSGAVWSDGRWLHLLDLGYVVLRAETTDDTPDGLIREIMVTGFQKECAADVQVLTGAAYWAASQYGEYGKYVMQIVFMEDHSADWFGREPFPIWSENGYRLIYGMTETACPYGLIAFSEDLATEGGFKPFDPDGMASIPSGRTLDSVLEKLKDSAESGPMKGALSVPALPETWQDAMDGRVYSIYWDDCALICYTDGEGVMLRSASLACMSGDTVSACMHLFPLYAAVSGPDTDAEAVVSAIMGGHGTWEDMCALSPFCVTGGVMLQCGLQEINGDELPIAFICGAERIPAGSDDTQ